MRVTASSFLNYSFAVEKTIMPVEQYRGALWNSKGHKNLLWVSSAVPATVAQSQPAAGGGRKWISVHQKRDPAVITILRHP